MTTFQWRRCGADGTGCADIPGETSSTYVVDIADLGQTIRVQVDGISSAAVGPIVASGGGGTSNGASLYARMPESSHIDVSPGSSGTHIVAAGGPVNTAFSASTSGDVIYLRGGSYGYNDFSNHTFSASNPVTVMPYPGDSVTITGPTLAGYNGMFSAFSSGIRFVGITWACAKAVNGIKLSSCHDIEFDTCVFRDAGSTSATGGQGMLLGSFNKNPWTPCSNIQIWNSEIYNWHANPLSPNGNHGIYMATTDHCQVANTVIYNTVSGAGYGIQLGAASAYAIIANNTIDGITSASTGTAGSGIVVWGSSTEGSSAQVTRGCKIINNLFTNNKHWGVSASGSSPNPDSLVDYCMAYNNPSGTYLPTFGSNTLFVVGGNNITPVNPQYQNQAGHDYHLTVSTPASVRTGADPNYAPPLDKDGTARSGTPALGAYA